MRISENIYPANRALLCSERKRDKADEKIHLDTMSATLMSLKFLIMTNNSVRPEAALKESIELWIFESVLPRHHQNGVCYEYA